MYRIKRHCYIVICYWISSMANSGMSRQLVGIAEEGIEDTKSDLSTNGRASISPSADYAGAGNHHSELAKSSQRAHTVSFSQDTQAVSSAQSVPCAQPAQSAQLARRFNTLVGNAPRLMPLRRNSVGYIATVLPDVYAPRPDSSQSSLSQGSSVGKYLKEAEARRRIVQAEMLGRPLDTDMVRPLIECTTHTINWMTAL